MDYIEDNAEIQGTFETVIGLPRSEFVFAGGVAIPVYGPLSEEHLSKKLFFATGPNAQARKGWVANEGTLSSAIPYLAKHKPGQKDGRSVLQGKSVDGTRKKNAMAWCDMVCLDFDGVGSPETIAKRIAERGWFAIVASTHSQGKNTTTLSPSVVTNYCDIDESDIDEEHVRRYLAEVNLIEPVKLLGLRIEKRRGGNGNEILAIHQPLDRFRVIFPLRERFNFNGATQDKLRKQHEDWSGGYRGLSVELGTPIDESCADPSRLFYLPRHANTDEARDAAYSFVIAGEFLDFATVPRVAKASQRKAKAKAAYKPTGDALADLAAQAAGDGGDGSERKEWKTDPLLGSFLWRVRDRFEAKEFFGAYQDRADDQVNKLECECPFDHEHSNSGDPDDRGFVCFDAEDTEKQVCFAASCRHNSCGAYSGFDFVDEVASREGLSLDDLCQFVPGVESEPDAGDILAELRGGGRVAFGTMQANGEPCDYPYYAGSITRWTEPKYTTAWYYFDDTFEELKALNRQCALVRVGSGVRFLTEARELGEKPGFMLRNDWVTWLANKQVLVPDPKDSNKKKLAPLSKIWLEWPERRQYEGGACFAPGKDKEGCYNLFVGFPYRPVAGDWSLMREHIRENLCGGDEKLFEWVLLWMADLFQRPGKKVGSSLVIQGKKGTGKSFVADELTKALGVHGVKVAQKEHLLGRFNAIHEGVLLLVAEETFWGGDVSAGGVLKDMITSEKTVIERKNIDPVVTDNFMRLICVSNESWIVPASLGDERRFCVLMASDARRGDLAFFAAMAKQMAPLEEGGAGGLNAMIAELITMQPPEPLGWDALRTPPVTEGLRMQALETLDAGERFFAKLLTEGELPPLSYPDVPGLELSDSAEGCFVSCSVLADQYAAYIRANGNRHQADNGKRRNELARKWLQIGERRNRRIGSMVEKVYPVPRLSMLRAAAVSAGLILPSDYEAEDL